jgi:hypothetical protein
LVPDVDFVVRGRWLRFWLRHGRPGGLLMVAAPVGILSYMASKVWTAAELEKLTPAQRHEIFEASVVTDLADAPPKLVARSRARVEQLIAEAGSQPG